MFRTHAKTHHPATRAHLIHLYEYAFLGILLAVAASLTVYALVNRPLPATESSNPAAAVSAPGAAPDTMQGYWKYVRENQRPVVYANPSSTEVRRADLGAYWQQYVPVKGMPAGTAPAARQAWGGGYWQYFMEGSR